VLETLSFDLGALPRGGHHNIYTMLYALGSISNNNNNNNNNNGLPMIDDLFDDPRTIRSHLEYFGTRQEEAA
jgi:hypothetical protein